MFLSVSLSSVISPFLVINFTNLTHPFSLFFLPWSMNVCHIADFLKEPTVVHLIFAIDFLFFSFYSFSFLHYACFGFSLFFFPSSLR